MGGLLHIATVAGVAALILVPESSLGCILGPSSAVASMAFNVFLDLLKNSPLLSFSLYCCRMLQ